MGLISRVSSRTYRNMGKKGPNSKGYKGPRPGQPVKKAKPTASKLKPKNFQKPKFANQNSKPHPKIDLLELGGTEEDVKLLAGIDEENAETLEFNEKAENMTSLADEMMKIIGE